MASDRCSGDPSHPATLLCFCNPSRPESFCQRCFEQHRTVPGAHEFVRTTIDLSCQESLYFCNLCENVANFLCSCQWKAVHLCSGCKEKHTGDGHCIFPVEMVMRFDAEEMRVQMGKIAAAMHSFQRDIDHISMCQQEIQSRYLLIANALRDFTEREVAQLEALKESYRRVSDQSWTIINGCIVNPRIPTNAIQRIWDFDPTTTYSQFTFSAGTSHARFYELLDVDWSSKIDCAGQCRNSDVMWNGNVESKKIAAEMLTYNFNSLLQLQQVCEAAVQARNLDILPVSVLSAYLLKWYTSEKAKKVALSIEITGEKSQWVKAVWLSYLAEIGNDQVLTSSCFEQQVKKEAGEFYDNGKARIDVNALSKQVSFATQECQQLRTTLSGKESMISLQQTNKSLQDQLANRQDMIGTLTQQLHSSRKILIEVVFVLAAVLVCCFLAH